MTEKYKGAFEKLQAQSRIVEVRMPNQLTDEQRSELTQKIREFCSQHEISQRTLSKMAGVTGSVISQVLSGTYRGKVEGVMSRLISVMEAEKARRAESGNRRFIETRVAREVFTVARTAMNAGRICVVYGRSGIGKSMALRAIVAKYPQAVLLEINDGCNAPSYLYGELFRAVNARGTNGTKASHFRGLVETLKDSNRLLIFDEAENLTRTSLNAIRQLHDATGCPMLLAGRPPLWKKIQDTRDDARMGGGLIGRILVKRAIDRRSTGTDGRPSEPLFSEDEILQMIARWEVRLAPAASKWLCAVANLVMLDDGREGCGLRYALSCFELAIKVNKGARWITLQMLKDVNAELLDEDYVSQVETEISAWTQRFAKLA